MEYYLVSKENYFKFEWQGADPSFVMLAPLHEALEELGAFTADAEGAWPGSEGTAYFYIPDGNTPEIGALFSSLDWEGFLTVGRIRDTLQISQTHAQELIEPALREADRLTELLRTATEHQAGLLCVVY